MFTPKQVGERIKERRIELGLSMPELGKRIGVNKSTIQRYEADGVDPKRTMIINGLADALLTIPEWLTGLSNDKEYDNRTLCQKDIEQHIKKYLDTVSSTVSGEPHQQLLTTFLGKLAQPFEQTGFCIQFRFLCVSPGSLLFCILKQPGQLLLLLLAMLLPGLIAGHFLLNRGYLLLGRTHFLLGFVRFAALFQQVVKP